MEFVFGKLKYKKEKKRNCITFMKNIVKRDQKRRRLLLKNESKRVQYKSILKKIYIPGKI